MYSLGNPSVLLSIQLTRSLFARANSSKRPLKWWSCPPCSDSILSSPHGFSVMFLSHFMADGAWCASAVAVPPAMSLSDDGGEGTEVQAASCITIC